jgi:hypothetical protein
LSGEERKRKKRHLVVIRYASTSSIRWPPLTIGTGRPTGVW